MTVKTKLKTPYAIDLGNGYTKRIWKDSEVYVEPSALVEVYNYFGGFDNVINVNDRNLCIGKDVLKLLSDDHLLEGAVGEERYFKTEFKELFLGFIAKDFQDDVELPVVVVGLPVNDFTKYKEKLQKELKGRHLVTFNEDDIMIKIGEVKCLPQPIGTLIYLREQEVIEKDDEVLVVDIGFGTVDMTHLSGTYVVNRKGTDKGAIKPFSKIVRLLEEEFGSSYKFDPYLLPKHFEDKVKINGDVTDIKNKDYTIKILDKHFKDIVRDVERFFTLTNIDKVVWTGGTSELHADRIESLDWKFENIIVDNSQIANALGFYEVGKGVMDK